MRNFEKIYYETIEKIDAVEDIGNVPGLLRKITQSYGLKNVAYFAVSQHGIPDEDPYVAVTYSKDWVEHYKTNNFAGYDPVLLRGFNSLLPFDWRSIDKEKQKIRDFFGQAGEFGVGRNGLTFSIHGTHSERALVTLTSDVTNREWDKTRHRYMRDFQMLGFHLHEMILRAEGIKFENVSLAKRQVECLKWTSQGKTASEIAGILTLSERTVRFYLETARQRLGVTNNVHAVAKAISGNLLIQR